ncbi:MAG TPA: hypothetical protein VF014_10675, partial [Casimicrobiaceae bacterium]|nr:hypothetical protein [Casimicrobiaceae bacterium]
MQHRRRWLRRERARANQRGGEGQRRERWRRLPRFNSPVMKSISDQSVSGATTMTSMASSPS